MINFVVENKTDTVRDDKIRRIGVAATTLVLVLYLVGAAGVIGWGVYWSTRQTKVSAEYADADNKLKGMAEQEVLVRKLSDRLTGIQTFLDGQGDLTSLTAATVGDTVKVLEWSITGGIVKVKVGGADPDAVRAFMLSMQDKFGAVQVSNIAYSSELGWTGTANLKGLKK